MSNLIVNVINSQEKDNLREFASLLRQSQKRYLLREDILTVFYQYCSLNEGDKNLYRNSDLGKLIYSVQEIILDEESLYLVVRSQIADQEAYRLRSDMTLETITVDELLHLRHQLIDCDYFQDGEVLKIDFQAFDEYSRHLSDSKKIGHEVDYLTRYLSSKLFDDYYGTWQEVLFNFLRLHKYNDRQLLINERIKNKAQLSEKVKRVIDLLEKYPDGTSYENFRFELRSFGFEPGWGNTACRARENFLLLLQLIDCASYQVLENFISRIPMVFKVLITSPHGFLGQEDVLERSDTAPKVFYILDRVKELEKQIQKNAVEAGLDVLGIIEPEIIVLIDLGTNSEDTPNQRLEKIYGSNNCWILRVREGESQQEITQNSISPNSISPFEFSPHKVESAV
jgi:sucrose synthase